MENWHTSTGIIRYDPYRGNMSKKIDWWAVLEVDKEITRYYRYWINKMVFNPLELNHDGINSKAAAKYPYTKLQQPAWDAHVSIIRGEKPRKDLTHLWKKYDGMKLEFQYRHNPRYSGDTTGDGRPDNFWFVEVNCPTLMAIRTELKRPTNWSLHLTVGKT